MTSKKYIKQGFQCFFAQCIYKRSLHVLPRQGVIVCFVGICVPVCLLPHRGGLVAMALGCWLKGRGIKSRQCGCISTEAKG